MAFASGERDASVRMPKPDEKQVFFIESEASKNSPRSISNRTWHFLLLRYQKQRALGMRFNPFARRFHYNGTVFIHPNIICQTPNKRGCCIYNQYAFRSLLGFVSRGRKTRVAKCFLRILCCKNV